MRMLQQRSAYFFSVLMVVALLASACAPAAPQAATEGDEAAGSAEAATLEMWLDVTGGADSAECTVAEVVDKFNEEFAGEIQVEATLQANAWDAARTALAGGAGPDIVQTPGPSWAAELARGGQLLPLNSYADEYGWNERFADWAMTLGNIDGELYSIPHELETLVLYYNKTLFEEMGWDVPETVDELMALAQTAQDNDIIPFAHANAESRNANGWHLNEAWNQIATPDTVYQALIGEIAWNESPELLEAVETLNAMQQSDYFMDGLDRYYTTTNDERRIAFGDGNAAMIMEGSWFMSSINDYFGEVAGNPNEWDWTSVPSKDGEDYYSLGLGSTFSINANTESPDAAADFLNYFFSAEVQARLVNNCGFNPAPITLDADMLDNVDPRVARLYEEMTRASDEGRYGYTLWTFWPPKSNSFVREELEKVWAGDITPQEYMDRVQDLYAEELEAGDVPPIPDRNVDSM